MQELVDEAAGEGFDGGKLFRAEKAEPGVHAPQFVLANLFCLVLQGDDGGGNVDGAAALMESIDFSVDERFRVACLRLTFGDVGGGNGLQIVDVVDEDAFDFIHGRIDVAGN